MKIEIHNPFEDLPIWDHFLKITEKESENCLMVSKHIAHALPLLERIPIAFPFYTLHNSQHQHNILRLIGELLGSKLTALTGLETAIVILSAIYHDIGMVYKPEELDQIATESMFQDFLAEDSGARLKYEELGKRVNESLIGWYCRWAHAKRVWIFLAEADQDLPLEWDSVPIINELGNVCESHNSSIESIKTDDDKFKIDFIGKCDLKFCAMLLRLGDILDFDDTRSPRSLYEFLELNKAKKGDDQISDEEWRKHMSAKGFTIERDQALPRLRFIAVPEHPKVEVGIRNFLKIIENELNSCARLLRFCSTRWAQFELPQEINIEGIKSKNYRSGNYHFSLAEDDVMTLLTGEGIYNDDFIFLRELLQNAIDTSRHREFRERLSAEGFKAEPITVSSFNDEEGYQWIRIDDYGMGMNLEIIERHLLKKGKSYYNSDAFKLEKLAIREKISTDFIPISRFGIGLLSCFISGDKIEISTLHKDEPNNPYRLSVEGRNGFFMLQSKTEHHRPAPMPAENGPEKNYRQQSGTSIAVRIVTNKEYDGFNVKAHLEKYLMAPPIPIKYDGYPVGGDFTALTQTPWASAQSFELESEFIERVRNLTGIPFEKGIKIAIFPVRLTEDALSKNLKGQLIITHVDLLGQSLGPQGDIHFTLDNREDKIEIQCNRRIKEGDTSVDRKETLDVSFLLKHLNIPEEITSYPFLHYNRHLNVIRFSHNGIRIPEDTKSLNLNRGVINSDVNNWGQLSNFNFICTGLIYFQDELLPNLTISRNEIRQMTYPTVAHMLTAMRALNNLILTNPQEQQFHFFETLERDVEFTSSDIRASKIYLDNRPFWDDYIQVHTELGQLSMSALMEKSSDHLEIFSTTYRSAFYRSLVDFVLEENFDIKIMDFQEGNQRFKRYFLSRKSKTTLAMVEGFEPRTFGYFSNSELLMLGRKINIEHPYIKWYAIAYPSLSVEYFHYTKQLIYALYGSWDSSKPDIDKINRILAKLRKILPEALRPPKEVDIKKKDFDW